MYFRWLQGFISLSPRIKGNGRTHLKNHQNGESCLHMHMCITTEFQLYLIYCVNTKIYYNRRHLIFVIISTFLCHTSQLCWLNSLQNSLSKFYVPFLVTCLINYTCIKSSLRNSTFLHLKFQVKYLCCIPKYRSQFILQLNIFHYYGHFFNVYTYLFMNSQSIPTAFSLKSFPAPVSYLRYHVTLIYYDSLFIFCL